MVRILCSFYSKWSSAPTPADLDSHSRVSSRTSLRGRVGKAPSRPLSQKAFLAVANLGSFPRSRSGKSGSQDRRQLENLFEDTWARRSPGRSVSRLKAQSKGKVPNRRRAGEKRPTGAGPTGRLRSKPSAAATMLNGDFAHRPGRYPIPFVLETPGEQTYDEVAARAAHRPGCQPTHADQCVAELHSPIEQQGGKEKRLREERIQAHRRLGFLADPTHHGPPS